MAKRERQSPSERVLARALALLTEQFGSAVVVVPETDMTAEEGQTHTLRIAMGGHPSHARGMLADAYQQVFEGEEEPGGQV
jgi:hypothetical protein